jgi:4-alpha-glucanotransferase
VALDSSDVWADRELFQFGSDGLPSAIAGCPPDGFSATGQLWGNPLYDWEYHRSTGYAWWIRRMKGCSQWYDVVRIDHFRGFDQYYAIPYGDKTAEHGRWQEGPGVELFYAIRSALGELDVIAEDLGFITEGVEKLVRDTGFPGMKVLEFAFDSREASNYLPHTYTPNCVVYTGTHDNETITGWYQNLCPEDLEYSREYMGNRWTPSEEIHWDFIRLAMMSVAGICMIPMQDYLGLDNRARMNQPSTLGENWKWRLQKDQVSPKLLEKIRRLTIISGRCNCE